MKKYIDMIENALYSYIPSGEHSEQKLIDAVEYSLRLPGKRVRPGLTLAFADLCGGSAEAALPFACAVEMIHTFSLIHDDMPCMDDDDFRRGKPSNHKVFGEAVALIAGDALQTLAFQVILTDGAARAGADRAARAGAILAEKAGLLGMCGGQVIDLVSEGKRVGIDTLREMDVKKTACLIEAACMMGCVCAGAPDELIGAAERYAHSVGVAFQIVDDMLDVTSTTDELGKPVGSDLENDKSTYVALLGVDRCRELVDELTAQAIDALAAFPGDTSGLADFAVALANRRK